MKAKILIATTLAVARHPTVRMYVEALRSDYELIVACSDAEAAAKAYPGVRCVQVRPPSTEAHGPAGRVRYLLRHARKHAYALMRLAAVRRVQLIVAVDGEILPAVRSLGTLLRVPYLYVMCEVWPNQFAHLSPGVVKAMALVEKWGVRGAARTIAFHPIGAKLLARRYGVPRSRFDSVFTCPPLPPRRAPLETGRPLRVYYHGYYIAGRGLENLLRAMHYVTGAHLYMRGLGDIEADLRAIVANEGLADRVTFLEPVPADRLAEAATEFDVGVIIACPTTANGRFVIGYKLFENMAAGLAIAGPHSRILGPFVATHGVGVTFEGCCSASIARALQHCAEHPEQVRTWKERVRAAAEREYNAAVQGERIRGIVAALAAGEVRSPAPLQAAR